MKNSENNTASKTKNWAYCC